ncbi:MAG: DNA alkylation repair protein [Candidatus Caccovivens sp.]
MTITKNFIKNNFEVDYAQFCKRLIETKYEICGVRLPKLRKFAKEINPENIDLKKACHEEILLYGFSASYCKTEAEQLEYLKKLLPYIDNWCTCDCIVGSLKKLKGQISYQFFSALLQDERPFYVRVGILGLMRNFLKSEKLDEILKNLSQISLDQYYVKMAIAWTYAEVCSFDFEKAKEQIENTSDKFVRNKAISKARDSFRVSQKHKEELSKLKI